jgi:hypothetical protein
MSQLLNLLGNETLIPLLIEKLAIEAPCHMTHALNLP